MKRDLWTRTLAEDPLLAGALRAELGERVMTYLDIENSDWAYKMWFGTSRIWWDAESGTFVDETRPEMLTDVLPVPGDRISCGKRKDLPKKQRRHRWVSLGADTKNKGAEGICEVSVSACIECGKDKR